MDQEIYVSGLRLLGRKSYTVHQLKEKLLKKYPTRGSEIHEVLQAFCGEGLLNDRAYIATFIDNVFRYKSYSLRKVRMQLMKRGIDATMLQQYLEEHEYDERAVIERLYEKESPLLLTREDRVKFIGKLERKGFFLGTIMEVVSLDN